MAELLDHETRRARGADIQAQVTGKPSTETATLLQETWRDFAFAEVWSRPGLDRRGRYLIAMAGCANTPGPNDQLVNDVRGALTEGELTLAELREGALHLACYAGFSKGDAWDDAITQVQEELGLAPAETPPLRGAPWDPQVRQEEGEAGFLKVMTFGGPPPNNGVPYMEAGILNFIFGEMWCRSGLDERSRRWITLVAVADSRCEIPIKSHFHSAMTSGNCKPPELHEFVLQYALHAGWPRGSDVQGAVFEMIQNFEADKPWSG
ncbi:MAG: carboxymuconolactone decarboxylase family protein [Novosphingobium sp.]|nr:carboxymuconolactone decarboxylase family protein [Novosphingobium sp.]